jgi:hypothetical protein
MKTNKYQRQEYTLMKRYNKIWTKIKAKMKTKCSSRKRRTLVEIIRMKNGVFLANEKQGNFSKRNLLGSNHLLKQTKLNKTEN